MPDRNRVTEKALLPDTFWVVSAEWRGGHDGRKIQLENIHFTEKAARADWNRLTPEYGSEHYKDFRRHPLRKFRSKTDAEERTDSE